MAALERTTKGGGARRFAVIMDEAPHLSDRRQAVQALCPDTGVILLFTDVMNVGNLRSTAEASFSCAACGGTHSAETGMCRGCG